MACWGEPIHRSRHHAEQHRFSACSVIFLRMALGTNAVKQPAINVGTAFAVAADAALGATLKPAFSPYKVIPASSRGARVDV